MFRHRIDEHAELRLLTPADARELYEVTDAHRAHLRRWLPWLDGTRSASDTEAFIQSTLRQFADGQGFNAAILIDGAIGGVVGHHRIS